MPLLSKITVAVVVVVALAASACGGSGGTKTETPTVSTGGASSPTGEPKPAVSPTASGAATPAVPSNPPTTSGRTYTAAEAKTIVDGSSLLPPDLPSGWKLQTDTVADNAAAALTDPKGGASFERCGRLLSRTAINQPFDVVSSFLAGETLSFFSSITAYATDAGAIDCSTEAAQRLVQPGELARALGKLFINPDAVQVAQVDYPQVGSGSFAATLTGQIDAAGTTIDLTVLIVAFRKGNVTAVVGSARSGQSPPTAELTPYVDKTLQRVTTFTD